MLGLTQQQMAELIGVTYQQAHKYEKGINRIAAGRLFTIAQALGVDVGYFFDGMDSERSFKPTPQQRMLLELARNFISMPSRKHQEAICNLARALVQSRAGGGPEATARSTDLHGALAGHGRARQRSCRRSEPRALASRVPTVLTSRRAATRRVGRQGGTSR